MSAALTSTAPSHPDAIPDLIPNQRITAVDEVPGRDGSSDDRLPLHPSLHNGRSDDLGRSSPHDLQKSRCCRLAISLKEFFRGQLLSVFVSLAVVVSVNRILLITVYVFASKINDDGAD